MKLHDRDLDMRQLEIFCRIVDYKSFSKAARILHLAQPTVSEHIANLEGTLKLRLLDRKGKRVALTSSGRLFYAYAVRILALKEELMKEMGEFSSQAKGHLVIGASSIPGSYLLPQYLTTFKKLYPEASITLKVRDTDEVIHDVKDGHYEIGAVGAKPKYPEMQSSVLGPDQLWVIVSPSHPAAARKSPLSPQMFSRIPLIVREKGSAHREILEQYFSKLKLPLNIICEMNSNEAIKEAVKNGDGASVLSFRAVEKEVRDGLLKQVRVRGVKFARSFYLIYHRHRTKSPVSQLFLEYMAGQGGS